MNGINWWRRLGIVCCVMVTLGCISGCQWNLDNLKQYSQDSSARDSKRMKRRGCFASIWLLQMSLTTMRLNTVANMI